jgi:hypothetical protein
MVAGNCDGGCYPDYHCNYVCVIPGIGTMIEPTTNDIGRKVVYTGNRYPGGLPEIGVITSINSRAVFVRYGDEKHAKATSRDDLDYCD